MIEIRRLQKNNIFYYAGKVYICSWTDSTSISAMETHSKGKHRYFKPNTKVLSISPNFIKKICSQRKMILDNQI
jgi:hypothetical protein